MKNLLFSLLLIIPIFGYSQKTGGNVDLGEEPPHTWSDADLGKSNGCKDGARPIAQAQSTFTSIMSNPYISADYKAAYEYSWVRCRIARASGSQITGSGMTGAAQCFLFGTNCNRSRWRTIFIYFDGGNQ